MNKEKTRNNPFLQAEWRKLLMANYVINPSYLKKYLPPKTELDFWNDKCYVSLVGFMFLNTKILGMKIPFHINFPEVNLRFYVRHFDGKEWKRGVVFIKEIVPKSMITIVANTLYKEKYQTLPMKYHLGFSIHDNEHHIQYCWGYGMKSKIYVVADENLSPIETGSEEEFITEHFWGYTKLSNSKTAQYEVKHPRWQVYPVKSYEINVDFEKVYGHHFNFLNNLKPDSVLLAEGSEIEVMKGKNI